MKKIGVLGCGWLGLPLAQELKKNNFTVKGTTTTLSKMGILQDCDIKPFYIDLSENKLDYLDYFLQNLDLLIIAIPPKREEELPTYCQNFTRLIPHIKKHKINKVIFMSSVSVYQPGKEIIDEDSIIYSSDATAQQILEAEKLFLNDSYINACILRLGGLFGPDRHVVRYICSQPQLTNPDLPINMVHLDDIIAFTLKIVQESFNSNCIYNLVSNKHISRKDFYTKRAQQENLILPPLGSNNQQDYKKVSGQKIVSFTQRDYSF